MIGDLKYRVTIQAAVMADDGGGGFTLAWQDVAENAEVYAAVTAAEGREVAAFHGLAAVATYRFVIRHRDDVTTAHRLVKGGAAYNIISLKDPTGERAWLEILAARQAS